MRAASTWFLWSILTLCIWIILIFGPATTWIHHGSLVPLLVLWVSPAWLLVRCWPRAACVLLVAQLTSFAATWVPSSHLVPQNISLAALMIAVGSLGGMGMLVWREWRGR